MHDAQRIRLGLGRQPIHGKVTDNARAAFDDAWAQETAFGPEMTYCKDEDAASLRELAQRMLAVFREHAVNEATLKAASLGQAKA